MKPSATTRAVRDPMTEHGPDQGDLLVVDDEPFLRDAVATSLRFLGFEVTTAAGAADALRLARGRPFDLVILDGDDYMTKPFGLAELAARIRTVLRRTRPSGFAAGLLTFADVELDQNTYEGRGGGP